MGVGYLELFEGGGLVLLVAHPAEVCLRKRERARERGREREREGEGERERERGRERRRLGEGK